MPIQAFLFSIAQFLLIVILLITFSYLLNLLLKRALKTSGEEDAKSKVSYTLFFSALFFAAGMVFKEIGAAGLSVLRLLAGGWAEGSALAEMAKFLLYFIGIGLVCFFLVVALSAYFYFLIRKVGILSSVANDDVSGSIVFGVNVVVFTLISLGYLRQILEYLVPYPGGAGFN